MHSPFLILFLSFDVLAKSVTRKNPVRKKTAVSDIPNLQDYQPNVPDYFKQMGFRKQPHLENGRPEGPVSRGSIYTPTVLALLDCVAYNEIEIVDRLSLKGYASNNMDGGHFDIKSGFIKFPITTKYDIGRYQKNIEDWKWVKKSKGCKKVPLKGFTPMDQDYIAYFFFSCRFKLVTQMNALDASMKSSANGSNQFSAIIKTLGKVWASLPEATLNDGHYSKGTMSELFKYFQKRYRIYAAE